MGYSMPHAQRLDNSELGSATAPQARQVVIYRALCTVVVLHFQWNVLWQPGETVKYSGTSNFRSAARSHRQPLVCTFIHATQWRTHLQGVASHVWSAVYAGECESRARIGQIIISVLALITLIVTASLFSLLHVDTHSLSSSAAAVVHGQLSFTILLCQIFLVAFVSVWPLTVSVWARIIVIIIVALVWLCLSLVMMPYYYHRM